MYSVWVIMVLLRYSEASTCESKYKCKETKTSAIFAYISMDKLNNTKLNGTILSTHYVENTTRCNKFCALHDGCVSTNVGPNNASTFVCQLLGEDRRTNAELLVNATGWSLFTTASGCDENPCTKTETCLPHYPNSSYKCVLKPYEQPLMNFTFDENLECVACNATASWGDGVRINVPDRKTKVLYFGEKDGKESKRQLHPEGCLKDLSLAFPGNCDSDGFVLSFWYRTFRRSYKVVLQYQGNGFLIFFLKNADNQMALWYFHFVTSKYEYTKKYQGPYPSQWIHLLLKFDIASDVFSVFFNGQHAFDAMKQENRWGIIESTEIDIASNPFVMKGYNGMFDDIVYYNRLLSNEEILNLHKEQSAH